MKFKVQDISCQHCVNAITKAIHSLDVNANVSVNLNQHEVDIENTFLSTDAAKNAIKEAGYQNIELIS